MILSPPPRFSPDPLRIPTRPSQVPPSHLGRTPRLSQSGPFSGGSLRPRPLFKVQPALHPFPCLEALAVSLHRTGGSTPDRTHYRLSTYFVQDTDIPPGRPTPPHPAKTTGEAGLEPQPAEPPPLPLFCTPTSAATDAHAHGGGAAATSACPPESAGAPRPATSHSACSGGRARAGPEFRLAPR